MTPPHPYSIHHSFASLQNNLHLPIQFLFTLKCPGTKTLALNIHSNYYVFMTYWKTNTVITLLQKNLVFSTL